MGVVLSQEGQAEVLGLVLKRCTALMGDLQYLVTSEELRDPTDVTRAQYVMDNFRVAIPALTAHLTKYWIGHASWSDTFRLIHPHCDLIDRGLNRGFALIPEEKHANPDHA